MDLNILLYPHPMLRTVARALRGDEINQNFVDKTGDVPRCVLSELIDAMRAAMKKHNGVGLAAPQVGYPVQLLITQSNVLINPRLVAMKGPRIPDSEGCLSLPGIRGYVMRHGKISVQYIDLGGTKRTLDFKGDEARVVQHETDHLNGVLISDIMAMSDREKYQPVLARMEEVFNQKEVLVGADEPVAAV